jgi:thiol-disulfide isomerase/thioredoxin
VERIRRARRLLDATGSRALLEVDGGITRETIARCRAAGADTFVAGNAVFGAADPQREIGALREVADAALLRTADRDAFMPLSSPSSLMTARRQWQIVLGVVAVLALGLWAATRLLGDELFTSRSGSRAPQFTARTLDAQPAPRTLADYKGKVVLLNVWATWCPPCREEMPSIEALHRDFGPARLEVVAVSVDDAASTQKVRDFVREFGTHLRRAAGSRGDIQRIYATTGVPENFVIGADGVVRKKAYAQDWNSSENRALVARLLDEAGATRRGAPAADRRRATHGGRPAAAPSMTDGPARGLGRAGRAGRAGGVHRAARQQGGRARPRRGALARRERRADEHLGDGARGPDLDGHRAPGGGAGAVRARVSGPRASSCSWARSRRCCAARSHRRARHAAARAACRRTSSCRCAARVRVREVRPRPSRCALARADAPAPRVRAARAASTP